ncbi:hypothetical protein GCM10011346_17840 [Oceanobacillus neutriphilus]|uniref:Uncharacterized protein n=1 Tax=Oceanobacillus neutriphilus TaxID=531815 RepID=A0ABQ2NTI7_9BACI|nr:hypothetical protein GCM10011346_17840 [Oceanobacillus neutriphilus]
MYDFRGYTDVNGGGDFSCCFGSQRGCKALIAERQVLRNNLLYFRIKEILNSLILYNKKEGFLYQGSHDAGNLLF